MSYTTSNNINIFPITNRSIDTIGRLTTEYHLTSILNKLLDVEGFVITSDKDGGFIDEPFEFNLYGYLIHINNIGKIIGKTSSSDTAIWANLSISSPEDDIDYRLLGVKGTDGSNGDSDNNNVASDEYGGVSFTSAKEANTYSLKILEKHN